MMKQLLFLILIVLVSTTGLFGQGNTSILEEVDRYMSGDRTSISPSNAASQLCEHVVRKCGGSVPHPAVQTAIATIIAHYRKQEDASEAGAYYKLLYGDLLASVIYSVQNVHKKDSKTCTIRKRELMEKLNRFMARLDSYMSCITRHSGWKSPKPPRYRHRAGPWGAPSPPPGDDEEEEYFDRNMGSINPIPAPQPPPGESKTGSYQTPEHPCADRLRLLNDDREALLRASRRIQEACE